METAKVNDMDVQADDVGLATETTTDLTLVNQQKMMTLEVNDDNTPPPLLSGQGETHEKIMHKNTADSETNT